MDLSMNDSVIVFATSTPVSAQLGAQTSIIEPSYMRNLFRCDYILETKLELDLQLEPDRSEEESVEVSCLRHIRHQLCTLGAVVSLIIALFWLQNRIKSDPSHSY